MFDAYYGLANADDLPTWILPLLNANELIATQLTSRKQLYVHVKNPLSKDTQIKNEESIQQNSKRI